MQQRHAKLMTGLVVVFFAILALGATAITTLNAQREHEAHESQLRRLSEKAAKVLPKEAFKPGTYTLTEKHYVDGYRVTAQAVVDSNGTLTHVEYNRLDHFGLYDPATGPAISTWNAALLKDPNTGKLTQGSADKTLFMTYKTYMSQLIHAAHTGEEHDLTVTNYVMKGKGAG
ncbi:hypothetical protein ACRYI5_10180 [Furfurilactobacillus sp. WILCCON 0119]